MFVVGFGIVMNLKNSVILAAFEVKVLTENKEL